MKRTGIIGLAIAATLAVCWLIQADVAEPDQQRSVSVIVQSRLSAADLVRGVGGEITHELDIIGAVTANVTPAARDALRADPRVQREIPGPVGHGLRDPTLSRV